jgi:hypothetical protein
MAELPFANALAGDCPEAVKMFAKSFRDEFVTVDGTPTLSPHNLDNVIAARQMYETGKVEC